MKNILFGLTLTFFAFYSYAQTNYSIKVKIKGFEDTVAYLGTYTGKNLYLYDTAVVSKDGSFEFTNTDMPHGLYSIIYSVSPPKYFDFIVNETIINLETDIEDVNGKMIVKKSKENTLFFDYIHFISAQGKEKSSLMSQRKSALDSNDEQLTSDLTTKVIYIDSVVNHYQKSKSRDNKETYFGKLVSMSLDIEIPEPDTAVKDTGYWKYDYRKNHFWDNTDLQNDGLGKSAIFYSRMEKFFMKVIPQTPDSINKYIDGFLSQLKPNGFMMKSAVEYLVYAHAQTKIMGMESVYVHVADNYILNGKSEWIDQGKREKLKPKVDKLRPTLIGKPVPNIILADTSEKKWMDLSKVESDYTLLVFWSEDCGHCKKELPKLKAVYDSIKATNTIDLEVYAVCTSVENKEWKEFVAKHDLNWINVSDFQDMRDNYRKYLNTNITTLQSINYRATFDVTVTPIAYLLDKDKIIVAKQFDSDQLPQVLEIIERQKNKK